ncbi:hypothetical protein [Pseudomonas japonica]|uniref:Tox-REase-5 domain-containing protein n=1 Tax=Pseudomonas japonica TaxID=256466 RepID=A0A239HKW5_9PSED|nr:hypothetical protein [Pseudomonas japonica]SNS81795.1 hypothetical protein SAMN05444352_115159 [Pseudomonas japonica]
MSNDADAGLEALAGDALNDRTPRPSNTCKACTQVGVPFSLNPGDGPREADALLGIPPSDRSVGLAWLVNNQWLKERHKARNFRDTFLLQVIASLEHMHGIAWLAEFYAFIAATNHEFVSIDIEMESETYVTPAFMGEVARVQVTPTGVNCERGNFVFHGDRIYFWSFTAASHSREAPTAQQPHQAPLGDFDWRISGFYSVEQAAKELTTHYLRAKEIQQGWNRFFGALELATGVLSFVPVVGMVARGLFGLNKGVVYVLAALEAALAANAVASGSTRLITGKDINLGEELFADLGRLADPVDGEARGRQVFMFINLVMLAPLAYGGASWLLRDFRRDAAPVGRMEVEALSEAERKPLGGRRRAEVKAIELHGGKKGTSAAEAEMGKTTWVDRPSLDSNRSQVSLTPATGKASYALMAGSLRERLIALIVHHAGSLKVVGRMARVVGDAGEEALVMKLTTTFGMDPRRIPGYSLDPRVPHRFGLTNKSGHGLDLLVWVPPPPELKVRVPSDRYRHSIDGATGPVQKTETLKFTGDTLLVIETKTTLGQKRTPAFNKTQQAGSEKVTDLLLNINKKRKGWNMSSITDVDPDSMKKAQALANAVAMKKVNYIHAQVFFDGGGNLNKFVGDGSGIQLNIW